MHPRLCEGSPALMLPDVADTMLLNDDSFAIDFESPDNPEPAKPLSFVIGPDGQFIVDDSFFTGDVTYGKRSKSAKVLVVGDQFDKQTLKQLTKGMKSKSAKLLQDRLEDMLVNPENYTDEDKIEPLLIEMNDGYVFSVMPKPKIRGRKAYQGTLSKADVEGVDLIGMAPMGGPESAKIKGIKRGQLISQNESLKPLIKGMKIRSAKLLEDF